jgi:hypothetical protein
MLKVKQYTAEIVVGKEDLPTLRSLAQELRRLTSYKVEVNELDEEHRTLIVSARVKLDAECLQKAGAKVGISASLWRFADEMTLKK